MEILADKYPLFLDWTYPGSTEMLWLGNVFHGSRFMDFGSKSLMAADAGDTCLELFSMGYIVPTVFNPSLSEATLLGLIYGNRPQDLKKKPDFGWAHGWDWMVVKQIAFSEEQAQAIAKRMYEAGQISSGKCVILDEASRPPYAKNEEIQDSFWVKEVCGKSPYFHSKIEALHIASRKFVTNVELLDELSRAFYGHNSD